MWKNLSVNGLWKKEQIHNRLHHKTQLVNEYQILICKIKNHQHLPEGFVLVEKLIRELDCDNLPWSSDDIVQAHRKFGHQSKRCPRFNGHGLTLTKCYPHIFLVLKNKDMKKNTSVNNDNLRITLDLHQH